MSDVIATDIVKRLAILESDRSVWDDIFENIRTYIYPTTASFSTSNPGERGLNRNSKIFDPTAERAHSDLVGAIMSGMTNQATRWFEYSVVNQKLLEIDEVRRHLEEATDQALAILSNPKSMFYPAVQEFYYEVTGLGTGVPFKRGAGSKSKFQTIPLADVYFEESFEGVVNTVYRPVYMTAAQILDQFPDLPEEAKVQVEQKLQGSPSDRLKVVHTVRPNTGLAPKEKDFESVYILADGEFVLEAAKGFDRFPFFVSRWEKIAGREALGRGPAMKALKDARVLNQMVKTNLEAGEITVRPPMQAGHMAFTKKLNLSPLAVNYYKFVAGLPDPSAKPIVTVGSLPIGLEMENQRRRAIEESFFIDLIAEEKQGRMTSLEVAQREQERLGRMAPQMSRLQSEFLGPLIEALYHEMLEEGIISKPPAELSVSQVAPVYNSPLARAQRQANSISFQRFMNTLAQAGQVFPEILKAPKPKALIEELRKIENIPLSLLKTEEEYDAAIDEEKDAEAQKDGVSQTKELTEAGLNIAEIQNKGGDLNDIF